MIDSSVCFNSNFGALWTALPTWQTYKAQFSPRMVLISLAIRISLDPISRRMLLSVMLLRIYDTTKISLDNPLFWSLPSLVYVRSRISSWGSESRFWKAGWTLRKKICRVIFSPFSRVADFETGASSVFLNRSRVFSAGSSGRFWRRRSAISRWRDFL